MSVRGNQGRHDRGRLEGADRHGNVPASFGGGIAPEGQRDRERIGVDACDGLLAVVRGDPGVANHDDLAVVEAVARRDDLDSGGHAAGAFVAGDLARALRPVPAGRRVGNIGSNDAEGIGIEDGDQVAAVVGGERIADHDAVAACETVRGRGHAERRDTVRGAVAGDRPAGGNEGLGDAEGAIVETQDGVEAVVGLDRGTMDGDLGA